MKIKLLVSRGGLEGSQNAGDIIEESEACVVRMVETGQAVAADDAAKEAVQKAIKARADAEAKAKAAAAKKAAAQKETATAKPSVEKATK